MTQSRTMKAMILDAAGGVEHFRWGDLPLPEPGPGEVRIRIEAVTLNPSDYKIRRGMLPVEPPLVLGRDAAGTIDAVGPDVAEFSIGDAVIAVLFGPRSNGAYAQYVVSHAGFVAPLPKGADPMRAASLGVAGLTAYEAVVMKADVQPGEPVFVAGGSGGVGSYVIPLIHMLGGGPVLATAGSDESAAYLTGTLGVLPENVLRYPGKSLEEMTGWVLETTGGRGVPAAFDLVGGAMKRLCFGVIAYYGRVTSVVEEYDPDFAIDIWHPIVSPLYVRTGSYHFVAVSAPARFGGPEHWGVFRKNLDVLTGWVEEGRLALPPVRDMGELNEENIRAAHTLLESGHVRGKLGLRVL
ncbi:MAG: alcohol dehydrogenase catalytic domain-containing protein [bacterium]